MLRGMGNEYRPKAAILKRLGNNGRYDSFYRGTQSGCQQILLVPYANLVGLSISAMSETRDFKLVYRMTMAGPIVCMTNHLESGRGLPPDLFKY